MKRAAQLLLRWFGWTTEIAEPPLPKSIICVAPHTSNWDFILGELAYASIGRKACFLMKDTWFFWPLGVFFSAIGGIAVPRSKKRRHRSLTEFIVERFDASEQLTLAITPEGTRSRTSEWHTGFLHIALQAGVPVQLGVIDYSLKRIIITRVLWPTGNIEADMRTIKDYYKPFKGKYPEKFTAE